MPAAVGSIVEVLILLVTLLANRLNLNSENSGKPPSSDPNRKKQTKRKTGRKKGGQEGHGGATLQKVDDPDVIETIGIDRRALPAGRFRDAGFEARQVFDIDISRVVTEYRAQVLEDEKGNQYVAPFPEGVTKAVQYETGIKNYPVYLSQFQLIPYNRIADNIADQLHQGYRISFCHKYRVWGSSELSVWINDVTDKCLFLQAHYNYMKLL